MILYYKLDGKSIVLCEDVIEWAEWFETADRHVALDLFLGIRVSTVFLGIDHNFLFSEEDRPVLFETMIFTQGYSAGDMRRYCTYEEAEAGHKEMVADIKSHPWSRTALPWLRYVWHSIMFPWFKIVVNKIWALGRKIKSR